VVQVVISRLDRDSDWGRDVRVYFELRHWPIPSELRTVLEEAETKRARELGAARAEAIRLLRPSPE
jgi:hypothetical protein